MPRWAEELRCAKPAGDAGDAELPGAGTFPWGKQGSSSASSCCSAGKSVISRGEQCQSCCCSPASTTPAKPKTEHPDHTCRRAIPSNKALLGTCTCQALSPVSPRTPQESPKNQTSSLITPTKFKKGIFARSSHWQLVLRKAF